VEIISPNRLHDISFEVSEGEILGIFGLMGAGQAELARAIFGLEPGRTGRILLFDQEIAVHHPTDAIRHGLGFLTRDRRQGLVPMLPIPPNITLANLSQSPLF
jgi:ribose transport system ATP-binding protein